MSIEPHLSSRGVADHRVNAPGTILSEIAVRRGVPFGGADYDDRKHQGTLDLRQIGTQVQLSFWRADGGMLWQTLYPTREDAEQAAWREFNIQPSRWAKDGSVPSATQLQLRKLWSGVRRVVEDRR